ncbi:MAG: IS630 transposase-related protein [Candidatus Ratteibacteria bacterium]|nr:IS630 transposase-related protein [Candidatus Ratteibacteria bacterium]
MDKDNKLSNRQLLAISHLIGSPSIEKASQKARVSRNTIYLWLKDEDFRMELKRQRDEVIRIALERLKSSITTAVEELIKLMGAEREEVRRLACNDIINHTLKSIEVEHIEERLDKVEKIVFERKSYR